MKTLESTRRFIQTWCKNKNISITEDERVVVPKAQYNKATGASAIMLPRISAVNYKEWQRLAFHESAHLAPRNRWHYDAVSQYDRDKDKLKYLIANLLIDNLAERDDYDTYRGRAKIMSESRMEYLEERKEVFEKVAGLEQENLLISAALYWDLHNREQWMLNFTSPLAEINDPQHSHFLERMKELHLDQALDYLAENEDVPGLLQVVDAVVGLLDEPPPQQEQEQEQEQQGEGDGEQQQSKEEEGGDKDENAAQQQSSSNFGEKQGSGKERGEQEEQEGAEGEAEAEGADGQADKEKGQGEASPGDMQQSDKAGADSGSDQVEVQLSIPGTEQTTESVPPTPIDPQLNVIFGEGIQGYNQDVLANQEYAYSGEHAAKKFNQQYVPGTSEYYVPKERRVVTKMDNDGAHDHDRRRAIMFAVNKCTLSRQVRKYLQLKSHGRRVHGVTKGKISGKMLYKLSIPQEDSQPRVFQKQMEGAVKLDSAVSLLVDMSGSMGSRSYSSKYVTAAASAITLSKALSGLRIPHEILGFTEHTNTHELFEFKAFHNQPVQEEELARRFSLRSIKQDHNTDGESVLEAAERLHRQKQKNKLLIVLSDGKPAGQYIGNGSWYLKKVLKDIEEHSTIKVIGIGIEDHHAAKFYKNHKIITDIEELPEAVLDTLKESLMK